MNTRWIIVSLSALLLGTSACGQRDNTLTDTQRAAIAGQVMKAGRAFEAAAERMDPDLFTKFALDSPDFRFLAPDGKAYTYAQSQTLWHGFVNAFASQSNPLHDTRVIVLSRDTALFSWQGGARVTGKDGTVYASTPMGGTDVFRKIGTDWKVIYIQESGPPPTPVTASR